VTDAGCEIMNYWSQLAKGPISSAPMPLESDEYEMRVEMDMKSRQKTSLMLVVFWLSVFFSPTIFMGAYLRIDQIVCPVVFLVLLICKRFRITSCPIVQAYVNFALVLSITATISAAVSVFGGTASISTYFMINWPSKIILNVITALLILNLRQRNNSLFLKDLMRVLTFVTFVFSIVSIAQVAEFKGYIPRIGVNTFLARFYPYRGSLSEDVLLKTQGYHLKMGGIGRATVTEGQPILAGNFCAFAAVLLLPTVRNMTTTISYCIIIVGMLLTLCRGAIIGWLVGVFVYVLLLGVHAIKRGKAQLLIRFSVLGIVIIMCLGGVIFVSPLGESIRVRAMGTLATMKGTGSPEGRITSVWPAVFDVFGQASWSSWLFGLSGSYDGPSDSQYLWILIHTGLIGVGAFVALHFSIVRSGWRFYRARCTAEDSLATLGLSLIAAVCALLAMYVVNPALQSDRLLTTLIVSSIMLCTCLSDMS